MDKRTITEPTLSGGTGRCLCGAVSYRYEGDPITVGVCQCNRCQRQSGSAFLIGVIFPQDAVSIEGKLASYESTLDGENRLWRHFCPKCGSAVSITLDRYPEIRSIMGGTLDDKTRIKPTFSVWSSSGQSWFKMPDEVKCFDDYPEGTFGG
jgi:hypothetical protein